MFDILPWLLKNQGYAVWGSSKQKKAVDRTQKKKGVALCGPYIAKKGGTHFVDRTSVKTLG